MSPGTPDLFGRPLEVDPTIALPSIDVTVIPKSGPLHKVQFVIEFVGQRSVLAGSAAQLLSADWYQALGHPNLFAMRPADLHWQPLTPSTMGSYDSLAMAWDLIGAQGALSNSSAKHLLDLAETFGPYIQRRAIAMPVPQEVNQAVRTLRQMKDALDIGCELSVMSSRAAFEEKELWIEFARLGLTYSPAGSFDWRAANCDYPLFSVTPIGQTDAFSLTNVAKGMTHVGVTIGFSVPRCAAPAQALDGAFQAAERLAVDLGGRILDDSDRELNDRVKAELHKNLADAIGLFSGFGLVTGSPEAISLFGI